MGVAMLKRILGLGRIRFKVDCAGGIRGDELRNLLLDVGVLDQLFSKRLVLGRNVAEECRCVREQLCGKLGVRSHPVFPCCACARRNVRRIQPLRDAGCVLSNMPPLRSVDHSISRTDDLQ